MPSAGCSRSPQPSEGAEAPAIQPLRAGYGLGRLPKHSEEVDILRLEKGPGRAGGNIA